MTRRLTSFAEVIESSLTTYTAQCWQWNQYPVFGSLVQVTDYKRTVYGIVTDAQTGSIDPSRTPMAYQKTEEELLAQQPHIFEFLKTSFTVHLCGYQDGADGEIVYTLPPSPCKIHAFVAPCDRAAVTAFFSSGQFLEVLFSGLNQIPNFDELLIALMRNLKNEGTLSPHFLEDVAHTFALLTGNDYRRIKLLLRRTQQMLG